MGSSGRGAVGTGVSRHEPRPVARERAPRRWRGCRALLVLALLAIVRPAALPGQAALAPAERPDGGRPPLLAVVTEEQAVARALRASPDVTDAAGDTRAAESAERVAVGNYLPSLAVTSSVTRSTGPAIGTQPVPGGMLENYGTGLVASLDLFTGGRRGAERASARALRGAADAALVERRFVAALGARRAFYEALRADDLVRVAEARVEQAQRAVAYAGARARAGTATRSDVLRARLELTTARQQRLAAADTLRNAAHALGRLVGAEGAVGAARPASLDPRPLAAGDSEVVALAAQAAPAVRAAAARAGAGDEAVRAARAQYVPTVRVTTGYNWANDVFVPGGVRPGWVLQLGTSYPLFDGFRRGEALTRAAAAARTARVTEADAGRLARAEAARLLGALHTAEENVALAGEAVGTAREDLRVQTARYRAGLSTMLDVLTSQTAVVQADLGLVAARYGYQTARAALEALVGQPL